ncbi:MAG: EAL domain-containing protein [Elainella sp.]
MTEQVIQDQAMLKAKFQDLYTSVNLSPTQLNLGDVDRLVQMLKGADSHFPAQITFEITENKLIEDQGQVVQDAITRLKLCGARLAIDDFGTGYSNIAYLQRLDVDQLKLDQLFIKGLAQGKPIDQLVDSLIDFGERIGLTIIAEGIETETQYQYLKARGVHYGQGWLFSRPLPLTEFERFLQANR